MESYLSFTHYDLVTPDGVIESLKPLADGSLEALVSIKEISPAFVGFKIPKEHLFFNIKSTLAQLGVNGIGTEYELDSVARRAGVKVHLKAFGSLAQAMLGLLTPGCYIGKLFAADERRRVREPDYLFRMFGRIDSHGKPLLSLGEGDESEGWIVEKEAGRTVAYLKLLQGVLHYDKTIHGFLPFLAKILLHPGLPSRTLLQLNQTWKQGAPHLAKPDDILLVKSKPLHIRTVFARVVDTLLPPGCSHTSASILEPTTAASGDVYELFGSCKQEIKEIPLEFYTLEPHREYVFFSDRDQLQHSIEDPRALFKAFQSAPQPESLLASVFVVKGEQLLNLKSSDWIARQSRKHEFPGLIYPGRQLQMVERYIVHQPAYPFLKAIEEGLITSEGILMTRYFPSPLMKRMLLDDRTKRILRGIYFQRPSLDHGEFFSHEDRSMLFDLAKFAIPVFWVDERHQQILQYVPKPDKDSGMFVPLNATNTFLKGVSVGIYGSNLIAGNFENELTKLLNGMLAMRKKNHHPLLNPETPLLLITGGGPGVMEVGNRVAKNLGILSCANIVDFGGKSGSVVNEQLQNPYIEAKMTYRIDKLVERQAEFNLDFPIFLIGGVGTDFEFALEEVRRKVGSCASTPVLLFGDPEYWKEKETSRFRCNLKAGTIAGSEWISNCFFCVQTAEQGLKVYKEFFDGTLAIGKGGPIYDDGFVVVE